jgi:CBS domain-containing protein
VPRWILEVEEASMQAKDIMTVNVISVSEDTPVHEIVGLLLKYRISAVPVLDNAQKVLGIVSEGDLLRPEGTSGGVTKRSWWLEAFFAGEALTDELAHGRTAGALMTRDVISVSEDTPLNEIAELLERHHIKRVPVVGDGRLVGIVSRANLMHGLAHTIIEHHEPGAAGDRELRQKLIKILLGTHQLDTVLLNVTVSHGNVRLWGVVENADQAAAAEAAAKSMPGVRSVVNNLGPGPMSGEPV